MSYVGHQQMALAIAPKVTSILSTITLMFFLRCVNCRKDNLQKMYHRLVLGMSMVDLIRSVNFVVGTHFMTADAENKYAGGSEMTCNAQGFINQLGLAVPLYGSALCLYAYLSIKNDFKAEAFASVEKWLHGACISFPVVLAIPLITCSNIATASGSWCWLPEFSKESLNWFGRVVVICSACLILASFLIGGTMLVLIFIMEDEKRTERKDWKGKKKFIEAARKKKAHNLIVQVALHLLVLILSNLFIIIFQFNGSARKNFPSILIGNILISLSGVFNVIVCTKVMQPSVSSDETCQISIRHISQRDLPVVTNGFDPPTTISTTFGNVFLFPDDEDDSEGFQIFTGDLGEDEENSDEENSDKENTLESQKISSKSDGGSFEVDHSSSQSISLTKGWPLFHIS